MLPTTWLTAALTVCAALVAASELHGDEPKKSASDTPPFLREFLALKKDYDDKARRLYEPLEKEFEASKTEAEYIQRYVAAKERLDALHAKRKTLVVPVVRQVLALIRPHAADPAAVEPLLWLVSDEGARDQGVDVVAAGLLQKHHLTHPKTLERAFHSKRSTDAWIERLLRAQLAANLPAEWRPKQMLALAIHLQSVAALATQLADAPNDELAQTERWCGKGRVAELKRLDVAPLEKEAIKLFTELAAKYPKEEVIPGLNTGDLARTSIFEIENLKNGKVIPKVEGEDLRGDKFRLSDYRGKVVLLVFWASWCGTCLAEVPHERQLAQRYKGRPFAVVGINADVKRADALKAQKEHNIPWRSYWCGKLGPMGPLPRAWNIHGYPTVYLIDARGVIRSNNPLIARLEARIARLVAEAEKVK